MGFVLAFLIAVLVGLGGGLGAISMKVDKALPQTAVPVSEYNADITADQAAADAQAAAAANAAFAAENPGVPLPVPVNYPNPNLSPRISGCNISISVAFSWFCRPKVRPVINIKQWINGCLVGAGVTGITDFIKDWINERRVNVKHLKKVKGAVLAGCVVGILVTYAPKTD